jgi:hypothetical protein
VKAHELCQLGSVLHKHCHWAKYELDFDFGIITNQDSGARLLPPHIVQRFKQWIGILGLGQSVHVVNSPPELQDDNYSCGICSFDKLEGFAFTGYPWLRSTKHLARAQYAILLCLADEVFEPHQFGLPTTSLVCACSIHKQLVFCLHAFAATWL